MTTGDVKTFQAGFPMIDSLSDLSVIWDMATVFDNTLSNVLYIGQSEIDFNPTLMLYNINIDQLIFNRQMFPPLGRPQWSPNFESIILQAQEVISATPSGSRIVLIGFNWKRYTTDKLERRSK
jgi:hypothetical protein